MKSTLYCLIVTLFATAVSVNSQFPQADRRQINIDAAEKARAAKEKAERDRPVYPPARMNVDVQMILANTERKNFADAKTVAVTKVSDGDPLWLYVKFNGTLERYVFRTTTPEGADRYILFLEMGPFGETRARNHYIIDFERADLSLAELKINLSPGVVGHLRAVPIFLRNAADLRPGVWKNEIRLTDRPALPRGASGYLAKIQITEDLSKGLGKYPNIFRNYSSMVLRGSIDNWRIPPPGKFDNFSLRRNVITTLTAQGIRPLSVYFASDNWAEYSDSPLSVRQVRTVYAVFTYQRGSNCLYGIAEIDQNFDSGTNSYSGTEMTFQKDFPASCGTAK
jgi:hypothetical protein